MTRARRWRVALLLALASAALLRATVDTLSPGGHWRLADFDAAGLAAMHAWRAPWLDALFRAVTPAGGLALLAPLALAIAVHDLRARRGRAAAFVPLALAWMIVYLTKGLVLRPRPELFAALVPLPASSSFPSGHAAQASAFALACLLRPGAGPARAWCVLLVPLAMGVCVARVYLQVHYPSDVLASALAATLWVMALRVAPLWECRAAAGQSGPRV